MAWLLRRLGATLLLAALTTFAVNVDAQTKESPLLLYRGDYYGPTPKKIKTVVPRYPRTARSGAMVLEVP
ncbi:MAG: hypothetical protein ACJ731_02740 [Vicinamibacterales bacterium]